MITRRADDAYILESALIPVKWQPEGNLQQGALSLAASRPHIQIVRVDLRYKMPTSAFLPEAGIKKLRALARQPPFVCEYREA